MLTYTYQRPAVVQTIVVTVDDRVPGGFVSQLYLARTSIEAEVNTTIPISRKGISQAHGAGDRRGTGGALRA
jgi:hypothetical protein